MIQNSRTHNEQLESNISTWWGFLSKNLKSSQGYARLHKTPIWWHVEWKSPLSHQLTVLESQPASCFTCQTCSINETCALLAVCVCRDSMLNYVAVDFQSWNKCKAFSIILDATWNRKLTGIHNSILKCTHLHTLKMQNQTKDLRCKNFIHDAMIFTLLSWLSRITWWFTCKWRSLLKESKH